MPIYRIVLYGWLLNRGGFKQDYALVDLTYFCDSPMPIDVQDVFRIIEGNGFKMIPKRVGGRDSPVESDKVQIDDWSQNVRNLNVGMEEMQVVKPQDAYPPGHSPPF